MLSSTFESLLLFYLKFTNLWPKILPRSPFYFQLCWFYSRVCNQAVKRGSLADVTYQVPHKQWIDAITSLDLWVSYLCQFVVSTCHCTVLYDVILKVPETVGGGGCPQNPQVHQDAHQPGPGKPTCRFCYFETRLFHSLLYHYGSPINCDHGNSCWYILYMYRVQMIKDSSF